MTTASPQKKINVAIIGTGIGKHHFLGYRALPDLWRVAAICDLDLERAKSIGAGPDCRLVTDYDTVLADPGIDVVDICLPPHLHFKVTMAALAAGKHVICEKPLVTSLGEIDRIGMKAKEVGRQVFPVFQYRYGLGYQRLMHLIAKGMAGKPFVGSLETHWHRGPEYYAVPWRGTWAGEQGGAIVGHAIHIHNLATRIFGRCVSVGTFLDSRVNPIETEDCGAIAMKMETGALVTSSITLGAANDTSRMRLCFEHVTAQSDREPYAIGSGNWTFTATDPKRQAEFDSAVAEISEGPASEGGTHHFAGMFKDIHDVLHGKSAPVLPTFEEARHSIELISAAYQSHRTGTISNLPLSSSHPLYDGWCLDTESAA